MRKIIFGIVGLVFLIITIGVVVKITHADGNLLAYWKLDETSTGSTAVDSSGNGYDATPHNSPVPSTDIPSTITFSDPRSLQFDGTQWLSIPDNSAFAMTNATFSVWVKFTDTTKGDMNMIAKRSSGGGQAQWQFGYNGSGNNFKVSLANGTSGNSCCHDFNWAPSPALTQNVWYNVAVTINNATHELKWYQDGNLKQTTDITGYALGSEIAGTDMTLGASYNGTGEKLYGLLDDVRIYNVALSGADIADIAAGSSGPGVPTPTPTHAPTATPAPASNTDHNAAVTANTSCTQSAPNTPNLFQISTSISNATVYFVPVSNATGYVISYGIDANADQYSASFDNSDTSGALSYTINALSPNTTYFVKIQAKNGCMPGNWSQILHQATLSTQTEQTTKPSSQALDPTPTPKGTISVIDQKQTQTQSSNPSQTGYSLTINVNNNGTPIVGTTVTLHSIPQQTTTDKMGIARFRNVKAGSHTVLLAYNGYSGEQKIAVTGDKKDIAVNMTIQLNDTGFHSPTVKIVLGILGVVIVGLILFIFVLFRKKRKKE